MKNIIMSMLLGSSILQMSCNNTVILQNAIHGAQPQINEMPWISKNVEKYAILKKDTVLTSRRVSPNSYMSYIYVLCEIGGKWKVCGFGIWPSDMDNTYPYQAIEKNGIVYVYNKESNKFIKIELSVDFKFPVDKDALFGRSIYKLLKSSEATKEWVD